MKKIIGKIELPNKVFVDMTHEVKTEVEYQIYTDLTLEIARQMIMHDQIQLSTFQTDTTIYGKKVYNLLVYTLQHKEIQDIAQLIADISNELPEEHHYLLKQLVYLIFDEADKAPEPKFKDKIQKLSK